MQLPKRLPLPTPAFIILTGIYDDAYLNSRQDAPPLCTSAGKRKILYQAITSAVGCTPTLLSPQPRGLLAPTAQSARDLDFAGLPQKFCRASGIRKIRYVADLIHYAKHVHAYLPDGALVVVDNYELMFAVALRHSRLRGRKFTVIIEYEDGKHLIDRGLMRFFSYWAERLIKPLVRGAILATPNLAVRLPAEVPISVVPGILADTIPVPTSTRDSNGRIHFLYSGSLDSERGIPLLLDYLSSDLVRPEVCVELTGQGHFTKELQDASKRLPDQVVFHGKVSEVLLQEIRNRCHFGLNLQSSRDPISEVTYPSKTFDYLNAGLRLVSTKAAGVESVLGSAAIYLEDESPQGLAYAIDRAIADTPDGRQLAALRENYSLAGTIRRLGDLFSASLASARRHHPQDL